MWQLRITHCEAKMLNQRHDDISYWKECFRRVPEDDILSRFIIEGKIKQLQRDAENDRHK